MNEQPTKQKRHRQKADPKGHTQEQPGQSGQLEQQTEQAMQSYLMRLGQLASTPTVHELPELPEPEIEKPSNLCVYAQQFDAWAQELCVGSVRNLSVVSLNQAKVLLLDKYMQWKASVPKRHRAYTASGPNSHICIYHVFETAYDRLRVLELSLTPPMLFLPLPPLPPPPPPPAPQVMGIFLGEDE